jgi:AmiR/NasT family two-component response regulator
MPDPPAYGPQSDRVSQATGIISVQAGCTLAEAFDLLRERAFALGQTLELTALDVIDGVLRFDE